MRWKVSCFKTSLSMSTSIFWCFEIQQDRKKNSGTKVLEGFYKLTLPNKVCFPFAKKTNLILLWNNEKKKFYITCARAKCFLLYVASQQKDKYKISSLAKYDNSWVSQALYSCRIVVASLFISFSTKLLLLCFCALLGDALPRGHILHPC